MMKPIERSYTQNVLLLVYALWREGGLVNIEVLEIHKLIKFQISLIRLHERRVWVHWERNGVFSRLVHVADTLTVVRDCRAFADRGH